MPETVDTFNKFFVGLGGVDEIVFALRPVPQRISKADALILAAWLVALADDQQEFGKILEAVQNT